MEYSNLDETNVVEQLLSVEITETNGDDLYALMEFAAARIMQLEAEVEKLQFNMEYPVEFEKTERHLTPFSWGLLTATITALAVAITWWFFKPY